MLKLPHNYTVSHASKVMLKILQVRFQQYVNRELPGVQAGFRKDRGTGDQIANNCWIIKKSKRVPEKHLFLLYWLPKPLTGECNPLQYSCLENPMDRGVWWATVHGVTKSDTTEHTAQAFDCVDHNKLWKIVKEMGIPDFWPASWEICLQVRKQQLELDMKQQTGSILG